MTDKAPPVLYEESTAHPGWMRWAFRDATRFNAFLGDMIVRVEDGIARVRIVPEHRHSNIANAVHGGALLGFVDVALFAASRAFGLIEAGSAVTLSLDTQFIGAGTIGEPLEARVELLKETGRLLFLRGLVVQEAGTVVAFSATIRKGARK